MGASIKKRAVFITLVCALTACVYWIVQRDLGLPQLTQGYSADAWQRNCSCNRCLVDDDPWFLERYRQSPAKPFLSSQILTANEFNWWKSLQSERSSIRHFEAVVKEVFDFFPRSVDFLDSSPLRCRKCAVVGNSGNLRGSHYGELIDSHEVIIRINQGRIKGFEEDVGNRTTLRAMYPESATDLDEATHLVLIPFKLIDLRWLITAFTNGSIKFTYRNVRSKIKASRKLVLVLNPAFMKYVHEVWLERRGRYPSTGFLTLALSMHICDQIDVFGFGADKNGNWHHYWDTTKTSSTAIHGGVNEYNLILKLHDRHKLTLYK